MGRSQIEDSINEVSSAYVQHEPVDVDCSVEPSRTRQEFADECDINVLMSRFEKTGVISHVNERQPMYLDLPEGGVPDLQTALNIVMQAEEAFMSLPAKVRKEFDNDALKFVEFAENPQNLESLREWGLAPPAQEQAPAPGTGAEPIAQAAPARAGAAAPAAAGAAAPNS